MNDRLSFGRQSEMELYGEKRSGRVEIGLL